MWLIAFSESWHDEHEAAFEGHVFFSKEGSTLGGDAGGGAATGAARHPAEVPGVARRLEG